MVAGSSSFTSRVKPRAFQSAAIWLPAAYRIGFDWRPGTRSSRVWGVFAAPRCQPSFAFFQPAAVRSFAAPRRSRATAGDAVALYAQEVGGTRLSARVAAPPYATVTRRARSIASRSARRIL